MKILKTFLYASLLLSGLVVQAQTNNGPMVSPKMNGVYYVGIIPYTTIQSTVTAACNSNVAAKVVIAPNIVPSDTIGGVLSCANVSLEDQRTAPYVVYTSVSNAFVATPSAAVAKTAADAAQTTANAAQTAANNAVTKATTSFGPSGTNHGVGAVPDPGATAGTTRYLREDGTWSTVSGGSATTDASQLTTGTLNAARIPSKLNSIVSPSINSEMSADQYSTVSGTNSNGFSQALGTCTSVGCVVKASMTYPYDAERSVAFTGPNQQIVDNRGGASYIRTNDVTPGVAFRDPVPFYRECNTHLTPDLGFAIPNGINDCFQIVSSTTAPGFNNGSNSTNSAYAGWPVTHALAIKAVYQNAGIKGPLSIDATVTSQGDFNVYKYFKHHGGSGRERATEGIELDAGAITEVPFFYSGTVTSKTGDTIKTTSDGVNGGFQDLGSSMRITKTNSNILTGYVIGKSTDAQGYQVFNLSASGLTPTRWCGTLDSFVDPPTKPSTGTNTVTTPVTFNVTLAGSGCGTGVPTVGDRFSLPGDSIDGNLLVTSATLISTGHWTVGANIRLFHGTGSAIYQWDLGRVGFSFAANNAPIAGRSPLKYFLEAVAAPSANQVTVVQMSGGVSRSGNDFNFGNVDLEHISLDSATALTATNGLVTVPVSQGGFFVQHPQLVNLSGVTISGATNSAFNNYCTGITNIIPTSTNGSIPTFQCTIASLPTGTQTSAANSSSFLGLGDTPYGNTEFTMAQEAQVIDIQNYSNGNPVVDGTLRLEPNSGSFFSVNDTFAQNHDYVLRTALSQTGIFNYNPYTFLSSGHVVGLNGSWVNNQFYAGDYTNFVPATNYFRHGGYQAPPQGYWLKGSNGTSGIWSNFGGMDYAPEGGFFLKVGCPLGGCVDPNFNYDLYQLGANGTTGTLNYNPYYNLLKVGIRLQQGVSTNKVITVSSNQAYWDTTYTSNKLVMTSDAFINMPGNGSGYGGQLFTTNICQDATGGRTAYLSGNQIGGIIPSSGPNVCWSQIFKFDETNNNWIAVSSAYSSAGQVAASSMLLAADPTLPLQAATKQYVDTVAGNDPTKNGVIILKQSNTGSDAGLATPTAGQVAIEIVAGKASVVKGTSSPSEICTIDGTGCPTKIVNVQIVTPTTALGANTCSASVATVTMTGLLTTSTFTTAFATDPSSVSGWGGSGGLTFVAWPTANTLNWKICNQSSASITPGAITLNVGAQ